MDDNWYEILGVASDADDAALRRAYRQRVKAAHPDVGGDPEEFRQVQRAWEVLGSDEGRRLFDAELARNTDTAGAAQHHSAPGATATPGDGFAAGPSAPRPGDVVAERAAHAVALRQRLAAHFIELARLEQAVVDVKLQWRANLTRADRAVLQQHFDALIGSAATVWEETDRLCALLGVDDAARPDTPQLAIIFGERVDEMGWDEPARVWFTEPFDLVTGPLWFRPTVALRARAAAFLALCCVLWWFGLAVGVGGGVPSSPPPLAAAVLLAAAFGAFGWPAVLSVGMLRRLQPMAVRRVAAGGVAGAVAAGSAWSQWSHGVVWVLAGAAAGAASTLTAPTVARARVALWASTAGLVVERWRRRRTKATSARRIRSFRANLTRGR
jgi:hypothetical protein